MSDAVCLVCGQRGSWEVLYLVPDGCSHQAVGLCSTRCRKAYNERTQELVRAGLVRDQRT